MLFGVSLSVSNGFDVMANGVIMDRSYYSGFL